MSFGRGNKLKKVGKGPQKKDKMAAFRNRPFRAGGLFSGAVHSAEPGRGSCKLGKKETSTKPESSGNSHLDITTHFFSLTTQSPNGEKYRRPPNSQRERTDPRGEFPISSSIFKNQPGRQGKKGKAKATDKEEGKRQRGTGQKVRRGKSPCLELVSWKRVVVSFARPDGVGVF